MQDWFNDIAISQTNYWNSLILKVDNDVKCNPYRDWLFMNEMSISNLKK